jgi:hypothetical protein
MGCPVHIWVPMMAGLAPVATLARDRVRGLLPNRKPDANPADRVEHMRRWSAVGSEAPATPPTAEPAAD